MKNDKCQNLNVLNSPTQKPIGPPVTLLLQIQVHTSSDLMPLVILNKKADFYSYENMNKEYLQKKTFCINVKNI
ncbi:MAG: hypothetical protein VW378_06310 [bacterium]